MRNENAAMSGTYQWMPNGYSNKIDEVDIYNNVQPIKLLRTFLETVNEGLYILVYQQPIVI